MQTEIVCRAHQILMTKEETKKAIEVMQAYVEGKAIEYNAGAGWCDFHEPGWNWVDREYRVKPEPRKWWVHEYRDGTTSRLYTMKETADNIPRGDIMRGKTIRVREDLE